MKNMFGFCLICSKFFYALFVLSELVRMQMLLPELVELNREDFSHMTITAQKLFWLGVHDVDFYGKLLIAGKEFAV